MRGVVKIGGAPGNMPAPLLGDLAERVRRGEEWVLVHGASGAMNRLCEAVDRPPRHVESPGGFRSRFVGAGERALFEAAASRISVELLELLHSRGASGRPFYPGDMGPVRGERKARLRILEKGRVRMLRDNYSGRVTKVLREPLENALEEGMVPLLPPLAWDPEEQLGLNVDGDRLAAAVAGALEASVLVIATNVPGLLEHPERPESLIREGSLNDWEQLEPLAQGNMKRKMLGCREALEAGVPRVILCSSSEERPLERGLEGGGTHLWHRVSMAAGA